MIGAGATSNVGEQTAAVFCARHAWNHTSVGPQFARMLGPDQPVYGINANGLDRVSDMVVAYLQEIRQTRSEGRVRIGGMCAGCMVAIEVARKLQDEGRQTGPVILVDPPVLSVGYEKRSSLRPTSAQSMRAGFAKRC